MCEGSMYSYISHTYQQELKERSPEVKRRMIAWRRGPRVVRIARGGMRMKRPVSGRRPKHLGTVKIKGNLSEKKVAVQRAYARYPNLWALGSYFLARDGRFSWYEVVMVDAHHPSIKADSEFRRRLPAKL